MTPWTIDYWTWHIYNHYKCSLYTKVFSSFLGTEVSEMEHETVQVCILLRWISKWMCHVMKLSVPLGNVVEEEKYRDFHVYVFKAVGPKFWFISLIFESLVSHEQPGCRRDIKFLATGDLQVQWDSDWACEEIDICKVIRWRKYAKCIASFVHWGESIRFGWIVRGFWSHAGWRESIELLKEPG